jgi:hypothetical protein
MQEPYVALKFMRKFYQWFVKKSLSIREEKG